MDRKILFEELVIYIIVRELTLAQCCPPSVNGRCEDAGHVWDEVLSLLQLGALPKTQGRPGSHRIGNCLIRQPLSSLRESEWNRRPMI